MRSRHFHSGRCFGLIVLVTSLSLSGASAAEADTKPNTPRLTEIVYSRVDGQELKLNLYQAVIPPIDGEVRPVPCVVFIHGGGWKNGDRKSGLKNAGWLTDHGFAVASIDYRLTDVAQWPAQIDDCYAAVRWIRENGKQYGIDPSRIGVWGTSAGAHLAALVGTRPDPSKSDTSSAVQAVCDWFGPTELMTMPPNNVGDGRTKEDVANSNGAKLLGATVREVPELAADASALDHVSSQDPPFLIMHGAEDSGVPLAQSQRLHAALIHAGVPSQFDVIPGAGHGGKEFRTPQRLATVARFFSRTLIPNWRQGGGPEGNFRVRNEQAPTTWSVAKNENVKWKVMLPESGQSTVVVWGDRVFFTTNRPVNEDSEIGSDIVAWCCDADTGATKWRHDLPAEYPLRLSGCFSDASAPAPVTDGKHVCFFNAGGQITCFDTDGNKLWEKGVMPVGRTQPALINGNVVFTKQSYMPKEGHFTHEHKNAGLDKWTQLEAIDIASGEVSWNTRCGVNMGCVPLPMTLSDGRTVMVVGRGGGHSPPEKPEGISMIDTSDGSTIWTLPLRKFMSTMTFNIVGDQVLVFDAGDHIWVDAASGKIVRRQSFVQDTAVRVHENGEWRTETRSIPIGKKTRAIIQQSNVVAGKYHYFRSYTQPWLGRVDVETGRIEHLQLPVQIRARPGAETERLWTWIDMDPSLTEKLKRSGKNASNVLPIQQWAFTPNNMKNSRGHVVMGDKRSMGNGWGHHASQVPTVIGDHLYVPTMSGTVYVIRWGAENLDENAIVAINDLGEVGESWNRASLSYANGRLYAHTIREVICIEAR